MRDPLSHRLQDRPGRLERRGVAADEEGQRPLLSRPSVRPETGASRKAKPRLAHPAGDRGRGVGAIVELSIGDRAAAKALHGSARAEVDLLDLGGVGEARDDELGLAGDLRPREAAGRAAELGRERPRLVEGPRREREREAGAGELRAMPVPIVPRPTKPTLSVMGLPSECRERERLSTRRRWSFGAVGAGLASPGRPARHSTCFAISCPGGPRAAPTAPVQMIVLVP